MSNLRSGFQAVAVLLVFLLSAPASSASADSGRLHIEDDPDLTALPELPANITDIDDFMAQLLRDNADVTVAQKEIERTRGVARQALAALLPTVNASGTAQYTQPSGAGYTTSPSGTGSGGSTAGATNLILTNSPFVATGTLALSQPLIAPRAWYAIGTSQRQLTSVRATAADRVRTTLITAVADLLAEVSAARTAEVSRVGLRAALEVMAMTARKLELGSATRLDFVRTKQDVENARAAVIKANEALQKAREALGLVMGADRPFGVSPALGAESIDTALQRRCQGRPIAQRADVIAASLEVEIAERTLQDSRLAYFPSLGLSSNAAISSIAQLSGANWSFNLLGTLTVPLWDGGQREGVSHSAHAALSVKQAQLGAVARSAAVQQAQTTRGITVGAAAQAVAQRSQAVAQETARLTRSAFASGTGTSFDVVDAARKAREAELDVIGKRYDLVRARVEALLAAATCSL